MGLFEDANKELVLKREVERASILLEWEQNPELKAAFLKDIKEQN